MANSNRKDLPTVILGILLAAVVTVSTVIYLLTDNMIPGLTPFCTAALMVPLWKQQKQNKAVAVMLIIAAILNVAAGIMQIITAIYG